MPGTSPPAPTPATAYERFRRLCVERTLGGMPPYASMHTDLRRLAKAAKLGPDEEEALLRVLLTAPSIVRAPGGFWTAYRAVLVSVARQDPAVRGQLLTMFPGNCPDETWLEILEESGATAALTEPAGTVPAEAESPDGPAGWLTRLDRHRSGWRRERLAAQSTLVARMAPRLKADGAPVDLCPSRGNVDLDVVDLCLDARGAPRRGRRRRRLRGRAVAQGRQAGPPRPRPCRRAPAAAAARRAQHRGPPASRLAQHQGVTRGRGRGRRRAGPAHGAALVGGPARRQRDRAGPARHRRPAQAARAGRLPGGSRGQPGGGAPHHRARPRPVPRRHPARRGLRRIRLAGPGGRGRHAHRRGRIESDDDSYDAKVRLQRQWPQLVVRAGDQVAVVGGDGVELEHTLRIPTGQRHYDWSTVLRYVDGQLLVSWDVGEERGRYWSGTADDVFTAPDEAFTDQHPHLDRPAGRRAHRRRPAAARRRPVRARAGPGLQRRPALLDPRRVRSHESWRWHEYDVTTGVLGRPSLPAFFEAGAVDGETPAPESLAAAPPQAAGSPLGHRDGLVGWRVRRAADGRLGRSRP